MTDLGFDPTFVQILTPAMTATSRFAPLSGFDPTHRSPPHRIHARAGDRKKIGFVITGL